MCTYEDDARNWSVGEQLFRLFDGFNVKIGFDISTMIAILTEFAVNSFQKKVIKRVPEFIYSRTEQQANFTLMLLE